MSTGQDPRHLPGGGENPTPPEPVQVQWPHTVAVILNPSSRGDGMVMACATALAGSEVPLAVLPLGTGNLVAANFDIPSDLDRALEIALACRRRRIDLGAIGDGRFVIAAGMGFDIYAGPGPATVFG